MESEKTNKSLRLFGILMKLHLLSINILLSISYILRLKTIIKEKDSIITNIIEYLKTTEDDAYIDKIQNILNEYNNNIQDNQKGSNLLNENISINKNNNEESEEDNSINTALNTKLNKLALNDTANKYKKKRTYMEMINGNSKIVNNNKDESSIKDNILNSNEKTKEIKKTPKNKIYPKMLNKDIDKHYYHLDNKNNKWQFLEMNGVKKYYYFRCTTKGCKAFAKIDRNDKEKNFILTKNHNINYYNHTYYLKKLSAEDLLKEKLTKEEWDKDNIRINLFR